MRGRDSLRSSRASGLGITPAYAGKSPLPLCRHGSPWDHPRVCGEERQCYLVGVATPGSPPRMRGRERGSARKGAPSRITPAYAGKRTGRYTPFQAWEDHPRVCGEEQSAPIKAIANLGSPPRMRGREARNPPGTPGTRITPAYAGKRPTSASPRLSPEDHPRVCGEESLNRFQGLVKFGSPPRMRGRVTKYVCKPQGVGITPAYAGKSYIEKAKELPPRDHPRVCGEEAYSKVIAGSLWGSPPRMRGRARGIDARKRPDWITPAYAGKRPMFSGPLQATGDHPRVCGEEERVNRCACWTEGSPPRMRGRGRLRQL